MPDMGSLPIASDQPPDMSHACVTLAKCELPQVTKGRGWAMDRLLLAPMADLLMMKLLDGAERSVANWQELLPQAGFKLGKFQPTAAIFCFIECIPV